MTETPGSEIELRHTEAPIARADTDSWTQVVGMTAKLAAEIAGTEFVPRDLRGKPAAVTAAILYGREIGLPPMTSLTQTHVIEGKPAASAEAMRALVLAAGHELIVVETTGAICKMRARRRGSSTWTELAWTIDQARAAGLLSAKKENWQKYPRAMLQARCSAELIRLVFPDVVLGMVALEEIDTPEEPAAETPVSRAPAPTPRKRAQSARKAAAPRADTAPAPAPDAMPLPGEDGYTETPPEEPAHADLPADEPKSGQPDPRIDEAAEEPFQRPHDVVASGDGNGHTEYRCTVCGYRGETDPPLPCPGPPDEDAAREEQRPTPAPISRPQVRMLNARLGGLASAAGVTLDDNERRGIVRVLAGREEPIESTTNLSKAEGSAVIDTLTRVETLEELYGIVEATVEAMRGQAPQVDEDGAVDAEIVEDPS